MRTHFHITVLAPYKVFPAQMGGQRAIDQLYQALSKYIPVTIVGVNDNKTPVNRGFDVKNILGSGKLRYANPLLFFRLKNLMASIESKYLILVHPYFGWLGVALKLFAGKHLTIQTQNIEGERFKTMGKSWWWFLWQYEKWVHRMADENFFITQEDLDFAIKHFNLKRDKCHVITYGFDKKSAPNYDELLAAKQKIRSTYKISDNEQVLFFNGSLDYRPNAVALDDIVQHVLPRLKSAGYAYRFIVCGKGLDKKYNDFKDRVDIHYAGFVDDIELYFKGSDIFLNAVIEGGGIKTKLVEALGFDLSVVSTESGAWGIPADITAGKMTIVKDYDWDAFAQAILKMNYDRHISPAYFSYFYWDDIAKKAAHILEKTT